MGPVCDHLQRLINSRQPDGSLRLTDADRERIAEAVDVMSAVATVRRGGRGGRRHDGGA